MRQVVALLTAVALVTAAVGTVAAVPTSPTALAAAVSGSTVTLTWTAPPGDVVAYRLEAGTAPGLANAANAVVGISPSYVATGVPPGVYYVRIRAVGPDGEGPPSNEVEVVVGAGGCGAPPSKPLLGPASVVTSAVTFTWMAAPGGCAASNFSLLAGSSPGLANIANLNVGAVVTFAAVAPPGTYYVRVVAQNAYGSSPPSNEVVAVVGGGGGCTVPPGAPLLSPASVSGTTVTFNWTAASSGCAATSYTLLAGSAPGLANMAIVNVGGALSFAASAPPGTYYVRVVAQNAHGASSPSNEALVVIGASAGWSATGSGDAVFDIPSHVTRVRIVASAPTAFAKVFSVSINGELTVSELLGTGGDGITRYEAVHDLAAGGHVSVVTSLDPTGLTWSFTQEP